jgi:hypothetical protein
VKKLIVWAVIIGLAAVGFTGCPSPSGPDEKPDPGLGLTITAWVNEDDTLVTDLPVSTALSRAAGDTLTVEAAAGLTDIQWSLNGADIPAPGGTAQSVSFAAVNYPAGAYNLGLRVKKGGVPYSLELEFTVTD